MIVPKAGMVDILTELMAACEQDNTFRDQSSSVQSKSVTLLSARNNFIVFFLLLGRHQSVDVVPAQTLAFKL